MILLNEKKFNIFDKKDKINFNKQQKTSKLDLLIKQYEDTLNFEYMQCPNCNDDKFISYGSYERYIIISNDVKIINIKRVMCKNCGKTHAIIPPFIKPYFLYESSFIDFTILLINVRNKKDKEIENALNLKRQLLFQWKKRFRKHKFYIITSFKTIHIKDIVSSLFQSDFILKYNTKNGTYYFS